MRRLQRNRKPVVVDDHLIALFRRALPAQEALWWDVLHVKRRMTNEQHVAASNACHAFEWACGVRPWEAGPLDDEPEDKWKPLRAALLAEIRRRDGSG